MGSKQEAFKAYDFDGDEGFKSYTRNIEIPGDQAAGMLKLKAKWYKNNVDPDFEVSSVKASTAPTPPEPATTTSSSRPPGASSTPARPAQRGTPGTAAVGPGDRTQLVLFGLQAGMLLLIPLYMQPFIAGLSQLAYRLFLTAAVVVQGIKVVRAHGAPRLSVAGFKAWAPQALPTADFSYLTSALVFLPQQPITLLLVPFAVMAAYGADAYAAQHLSHHQLWARYGARLHHMLIANKQAAQSQCAFTEILLGFLLLIYIFTPQRNLLLAFMHWNTLKTRYWLPETGPYHRQAWATLDRQTQGIRQQVPFFNKPIGYVQKWFAMRQ